MTSLLLVDDSPFVLDELSRIAGGDGGFTVAGRARNGAAALEMAERLRPDLISLDVDMPLLNGLATLKQLMTRRPVPTVMLSALTGADSPMTFECLRLGAVDVLEKPGGHDGSGLALQRGEILRRLRGAASVDPRTVRLGRMRRPAPRRPTVPGSSPRSLLVVSGGRAALGPLLTLLNSFPAGAGGALVARLDVPPSVAAAFSEYAARFSSLRVETQPDGTAIRPDTAYLLPASSTTLVVAEKGRPSLRSAARRPGDDPARSVEELFESAAGEFGAATTAVVLAGAPRGTVEGLRYVASRGGAIVGQSPASAADGQALRRAIEAGLVRPSRDLEELAGAAMAQLSRGRWA
ncbi:MAG: response regulator [Holophagales bacterium]|jgi:two-component system chemotaxis response regulator CheB|nr:response regulator [Holophagales bacterium]